METISNINDWQQLLRAAEEGDASAQYEVSCYYDDGFSIDGVELVSKDGKLAYEWARAAYENGNSSALESYAYFLSVGEFCKKDTDLAIKLYEEGIKNGSSTAAHNLGTIYRDQHNYETAFSLYELGGEDPSVGMCYYYGIGVPQDKLKALRSFEGLLENKANLCMYDVNEVHYMLGRIYLEGEIVDRSLEKARHHLLLANEDEDHRSAQQLLWIIGSG